MDDILNLINNIKVLELILGIGTAYIGVTVTKKWLKTIKKINQIKKERQELEEKKCKGAHNWFEMEIMGEKTHVCRDCYWTPKHETFVKKFYVKAEIERVEFEKNLQKYKTQKIEELAAKFFMETYDLKIVAEEILSIKKDFIAEHLDKKIKEMLGDNLK